jgi:endonuclease/exonuclease/phosphatase family metal-dependent hydrolase
MLTIASYNIHRCIGTDAIYRPGRIVDVIREMDADIVALQEVDAHLMHKEGHQLDYIAQATGYHSVIGGTMLSEGAEYGNAILSRVPILSSTKHEITVAPWEPRGLLAVDVEIHGQRVKMGCTHLGLRYGERRRQVRAILEAFVSDNDPELITVLAGDFNDWLPGIGPTRSLERHFHHTPGIRTYPSWMPLLALDRIFVGRPRVLLRTEVFGTPLARRASDHLPVKAYFKLAP